MVRKGGLPPAASGQRVGIFGLATQARGQLGADALHGIGIEARLVQGETKQVHCRIDRPAERLHPARNGVTLGTERDLDRLVVERAMKALGIELPGTLVEQARHHGGGSALAAGILGRTAPEREIDRHERNGVVLHEPSFDAAG